MKDVREGTLKTCFDMCQVGKLQTPQKEYLRKRTVVHTTSRRMHELLDSRFCQGRHQHRPIEGSFKGQQGWQSLSQFAARYTRTFAVQLVPYFKARKGQQEFPVMWDELLADVGQPSQDQLAMVGEVVKRRRLIGKQAAVTVTGESSREADRKRGFWHR